MYQNNSSYVIPLLTLTFFFRPLQRLVLSSMELAKQRKSLLDDPLDVWDAESDQDEDTIWILHPSPDKGKKRPLEHPSSDSRKSRA